MSAAVLALVLGSAVVHATWNLWTKQLGAATRSAALLWLLTAISSVCYAPFALALLRTSGWRPDGADLALIAGSGAIHVGYFVLLLRGYRAGDLSLVYPLARGTGPLLATAGAVALFAERPNVASVSGALLIALGVMIITWGEWPRGSERLSAGVRYGLATGIAIAVYTLWDGWGVKRAGVPPLVFYWGGEVVRVLLLTPFVLRERGAVAGMWRANPARVAGIALLSPLSYILILLALQHGDVGHIAPAREVSIVIGAWFGGRVLGEGARRRRLAAAAAFAAGVIALALA